MELLCENKAIIIALMYGLGFLGFLVLSKVEPSIEFYRQYNLTKKDVFILFFPNQLKSIGLSKLDLKRVESYLLWKWIFLTVMILAVFTPSILRELCR